MSKKRYAFEKYYTVCGNPIAHSLSPIIHQHFSAQTGNEFFYDKTSVPLVGFKDFLWRFRDRGGSGLNITLPFKQQAFQMMHRLTPEAQAAGSVNTIRIESNGDFYGHNTDGLGFLADLEYHSQENSLEGKQILLVGAGGAARGIVAALSHAGVSGIHISNRSLESPMQLVNEFENPLLSYSDFTQIPEQNYDVIINATSYLSNFSFLSKRFSSACLFYDLSYHQAAFTNYAISHNVQRTYNGYGMLLEQAAFAFEFWWGVHPSTTALR